ncbi:MAG TPA: tetratricopeptide repeat protein [bacterium]|nr:tetratricopeptide repeat protein [bacterium]
MKKIISRTGAAVLGVVMACGIFEISLRIAKWPPYQTPQQVLESENSYPSFDYWYLDIYEDFFKKVHRDSEWVYEPRRKEHQSRSFSVRKKTGLKRIFILGGSVAQQVSYALNEYLKSADSFKQLELISCAMAGYDSYRVRLVGNEIMHYDPDLVIVISGHNDMYRLRKVSRLKYGTALFARFKTGQLAAEFMDPAVRIVPEAFDAFYEKQIRKLVRRIREKGIPVVLSTLPVNTKDIPPDSPPFHEKKYFPVREAFHGRNYTMALKLLESAGIWEEWPFYADYLRAQCFEKLGEKNKARELYRRVLDGDFPRPRTCPPGRNDLIRKIAEEEGLYLADTEKRFIETAPGGIPGWEFFTDECHLRYASGILFADEIVRAVREFEQREGRIILGNRMDMEERMSYSNLAELDRSRAKEQNMYGLALARAVDEALQKNSEFRENTAAYFENIFLMKNDLLEKIEEKRDELLKMIDGNVWKHPESSERFQNRWPMVLCYAGEIFRRHGEYSKARLFFNRAVEEDSEAWEPYFFRGLLSRNEGKRASAVKDFREVIRREEKFGWLEEI